MKNLVCIILMLILFPGIAQPDDDETGLPNGPPSGPPESTTPTLSRSSIPAEDASGDSETSAGTPSGGGYTFSNRGEPEYSVELQKSNEKRANTFFPGDEITVELKVQNMLKNRLRINYIEDEIPNTFELVNAVPGGYDHSISNNIQKIKWDYSQEPYITTKSNMLNKILYHAAL